MVFKLLFWFIAVLDLAHKKVEPCEKSNYTFTEKIILMQDKVRVRLPTGGENL